MYFVWGKIHLAIKGKEPGTWVFWAFSWRLCYNVLMKKLIVKSPIADMADFEMKALRAGLQFSAAIWQHERVYVPRDFRPNMNMPRLVMRTEVVTTEQPAQYYLYLKRHIEDSGVDLLNLTAIGDYTEASGIIHQLGFRKVAEVSRQRRELALDARTTIYLDVVEGLEGGFVKIEFVLDEATPVEAARQELFTTLSLFGRQTFLLQTYAEMLTNDIQPYFLPEIQREPEDDGPELDPEEEI